MPSNEYMRQYMTERRRQRRATLIEMLGGTCKRCDATEGLEFDHMNPAERSFRINGRGLDKPWNTLVAEAEKCQLLCRPHHLEKTIENGEIPVVEHGGGLSGKRNCQCASCKARKAEYMRAYGHPSRDHDLR